MRAYVRAAEQSTNAQWRYTAVADGRYTVRRIGATPDGIRAQCEVRFAAGSASRSLYQVDTVVLYPREATAMFVACMLTREPQHLFPLKLAHEVRATSSGCCLAYFCSYCYLARLQHIGLFWNVVINGLRGEAGTVEQALYDLVPSQCWAAFGHRELRSGAPPRLPLSVCNEICDSLSKALDERTRGAASGGGVASSAGASRDNDITEL